jgi:hypothetical protein
MSKQKTNDKGTQDPYDLLENFLNILLKDLEEAARAAAEQAAVEDDGGASD